MKRLAVCSLVGMVAFSVMLSAGSAAGRICGMSGFQGCIVLLGFLFLIVMVWAVRSLGSVVLAVGDEVKLALEELEGMWADVEEEPREEWQECSGRESDRRLYFSDRERVGEPLCPCGSGKPYSLCCGRN